MAIDLPPVPPGLGVIREGDTVRVKGDPYFEVWTVKAITVELGTHRQVASLELPNGVGRWVRPVQVAPLDELELIPVDLEDFAL